MKKTFITVITFLLLTCMLTGCDTGNTFASAGSKQLGDYRIEILDYTVDITEEEEIILELKILFSNLSDSPTNFDWVINRSVYQNGIKLEEIYRDENYNVSIQNGYEIELIFGYELTDTSDVVVRFENPWEAKNNVWERTIDIEGYINSVLS